MEKKFPDFSGKTILVAEDDLANLKFFESILGKTKANILWALNGIEAIEAFQQNKVDLILMDLKMPDMDGYTATKKLKEMDIKIPIIAQTAYAMIGDKEKAMKFGFDAYITKPINRNELYSILEDLLG